MWGDLQGEDSIERSIRAQIESVAKILDVDEQVVFPMSAKQALLAKVKGDAALLEKSRLKAFEDFLAEHVVRERQNLVLESIVQGLGHLVRESASSLEAQIGDAERQIGDLRQLDVNNKSKLAQLMAETRDQQSRYLAGVDQFQASRRVFAVQAKMLVDALAPEKIDEIIKRTRKQMAGSLTTVGMKAAMKSVLDELRAVLLSAVTICEETRKLVKGIYAKFQQEHGTAELKPPLLSLKQYQAELEQVFEEGETFRTSASSTLMEQSAVVIKLYTTTIARARGLFEQAYKDAIGWTTMALVPLVHQIKDHKRLIESRLEVLRKVNETGTSLDNEIAALTKSLAQLRQHTRSSRQSAVPYSWTPWKPLASRPTPRTIAPRHGLWRTDGQSTPTEHELPHRVPEPFAAQLELCARAMDSRRGERSRPGANVLQLLAALQHLQHLQRIVLPIGRRVESPARF